MESLPLYDAFNEITDPRIDRAKKHKLSNILVMSTVASMCGANDYQGVYDICEGLEDWFTDLLGLEDGIPCHQTFKRVIERVAPNQLANVFCTWINNVAKDADGTVIAIDGKRIRGSYDTKNQMSAIHALNAYATEAGFCLGQLKVGSKTNEIKAIPEMLESLRLKGCIVTLDAMGCQKDICERITEDHDADYVIGLKGNQGSIHEEVKEFFDLNPLDNLPYFETADVGHGRIEHRLYQSIQASAISHLEGWPGIASATMVTSTRTTKSTREKTVEQRFYISSIYSDQVKKI
jgi:predicted transposase YbfD/YdcC